MKQNFGLLAEFSLCGRQLANEMGDGAQGRKHIDLLGRSYAEETCKARKAWTNTNERSIPAKIPYSLDGFLSMTFSFEYMTLKTERGLSCLRLQEIRMQINLLGTLNSQRCQICITYYIWQRTHPDHNTCGLMVNTFCLQLQGNALILFQIFSSWIQDLGGFQLNLTYRSAFWRTFG